MSRHTPHPQKHPSDEPPDKPSVRQRLHSATGDRDAEAHVLAEEADLSEEAAEHAVREAAGDFEEPAAPHNIASPADVAERRDDSTG